MKTITINFGGHTGDGGYFWLTGWTWVVRNRIYIKGHWTPFMVCHYKFRYRVFHRLLRLLDEFFIWLKKSFLSLRSN